MKNKNFLIVCHISNPLKTYLPENLEEKYIYEEYNSECLSRVYFNLLKFINIFLKTINYVFFKLYF